MSLRAKVATVLIGVSLPLLGALAYNLGFVSEEDINAEVAKNYGGINQMVRDRMAACQRKTQEKKSDNDLERWDIQQFQEEARILGEENDLLHRTNTMRKESADSCEAKYDNLMDGRYTGPTIQEDITRLMFENDELEYQLSEENSTKRDKRASLRERIRALRLENKQHQANMGAWEAEVKRNEEELHRWEEEHAKYAANDYGFGQRDGNKGTSWLDEYNYDPKLKDAYADMDKNFWEEPANVYGPSTSASGYDAKKAEEAWAEWDRQMEEQMQNEDPDYLMWDDYKPGATPAPPS